MDEASKQAALSAVRTILGVIGGYLVGKGYVTEEMVAQIVGAIMALVPLAWGMWNAKRSEEKTQAREAVAVNVGIKVADNTAGPTAPVTQEETASVLAAHPEVVAPISALQKAIRRGLEKEAMDFACEADPHQQTDALDGLQSP